VVDGEITYDPDPERHISFVAAAAKMDGYTIIGDGARGPNPENEAVNTFGVQFAEVDVNVETGQVRVQRVTAVHDIGRVVNPMTATSQVYGGVLMGMGFGTTEERIIDSRTGLQLTSNLGGYKVPTLADVPRIEVESTVHNAADDHRLRVLFPSGARTDVYQADSPYDVVERPIAVPDGYELTTFTDDDIEGWSECRNAVFGSDVGPEWFRGHFQARPDFDSAGWFLVKHEGQIVGMSGALCARHMRDPERLSGGQIEYVAVRDEHRGLHLGELVVTACLNWLAERGVRRSVLITQPFRVPAIRLYEKLGFRTIAASHRWVKDLG